MTAHKTITRHPFEVFEFISGKSQKEAIQILKQNESFSLHTVLQLNFSNKVKLDLPEGAPPYTKDERATDVAASSLNKALAILPHLVVGEKMPRIKKEIRFIGLLESLYFRDSETIILAKDKKLQTVYPELTIEVVREAFPGLA
jgi:hypothetical protein